MLSSRIHLLYYLKFCLLPHFIDQALVFVRESKYALREARSSKVYLENLLVLFC